MSGHVWWLAARASGLVALLLATASVTVGLATSGHAVRRPPRRVLAAVHEQLATATLVAIAGHGVALACDAWLHPGITGVTVPFALGYRRVFTGLGVVAAYLAATLGLSFHIRRRIGPRRWRQAHRATVVVYVLAVVHALGAGTDGRTPWLTAFAVGSAALVAALATMRLTAPLRRRAA